MTTYGKVYMYAFGAPAALFTIFIAFGLCGAFDEPTGTASAATTASTTTSTTLKPVPPTTKGSLAPTGPGWKSPGDAAAAKRDDDAARLAIAKKAVASIKRPANWAEVKVTDAGSGPSITLFYRSTYDYEDITQAFFDTKKIARTVLTALVAAGHKPAEEDTMIFVAAYMAASRTTETKTTEGFLPLIRAVYQPDSDTIEVTDKRPGA
jgi:hypothetical protein